MNSIAVFCGSSLGKDPNFTDQAEQLGQLLAKQNIRLVYGGAKVGLMGVVANSALDHGGEVIGVIPKFIESKEVAHTQLTQLITVDTMHERKALMNDLCDGFIALPGGFGTLDELFESLTWAQLAIHSKPVGLLNVNGYYNHLNQLLEHMVTNGLLKEANKDLLIQSDSASELLRQMQNFEPNIVPKWNAEK